MIGWCCVAWEELCWKLSRLVGCACVFSCKVSPSLSKSKTHTPAPFSQLVIVLSVFRCWRMTFAMRAGLCLLFVDAHCSSHQQVCPSHLLVTIRAALLVCGSCLNSWRISGCFLVVVMLIVLAFLLLLREPLVSVLMWSWWPVVTYFFFFLGASVRCRGK